MTELEKKAEEYAIKKSCKRCNKLVCDYPSEYCKWYKSVFEIAKENEELKAQIKPLEDRICELRRKNASLENKVEKMKNCYNCKHTEIIGDFEPCNNCYNNCKWEM